MKWKEICDSIRKDINMNIRLLQEKEIRDIYEQKMPKDFAPGEIKPLSRILELCKLNKYFCYGIFEEEILLGYAFLVTSQKREAVLVDYYAIAREKRGKGYGSTCFAMLLSLAKKQQLGTLILEVEDPAYGIDEEDVELRKRRIGFYERNGMTLTNLRIFLYDVEYLVMTSDAEKYEETKDLIYGVYEVLLKPGKIHTKLKITVEK